VFEKIEETVRAKLKVYIMEEDDDDYAPYNPTQCPSWALAVGYAGVSLSVILCNVGSAIGTYKSGVSLLHAGIRNPKQAMKNIIPIVMSGVIGIYGLVVGKKQIFYNDVLVCDILSLELMRCQF